MAQILVIDDDRIITSLVKASLGLAGHDVTTVNDPEQAFGLASASAFDVIVLDVKMPGRSGFDILSELRADSRTSSVPVLFLSSLDRGKDRVRGLREGADDYLAKPFVPEELLLRVERLIASRPQPRSSLRTLEEGLRNGRPLDQMTLGRYRLETELGKGAMGTVFRCFDPKLKRPVALKTVRLDEDVIGDKQSELVSSLLREAIAAAQLNHPNVVAVFDLDDDPNGAFVVMELVDGVSLDDYISSHGPLTIEETVPLGVAIASGLGAAHARKLVHHDVKAANVLLGRSGTVKVTDFGLAQFMSSLADTPGTIFGTPGYLPPETLTGGGYGKTGDIFGLGAILYFTLTGEHAFQGETILEIARLTVQHHPSPPSEKRQEIGSDIDDLVLSLLAKDPAERPQTVSAVIEQLQAVCGGQNWQWRPDPAEIEAAQSKGPRRRSRISSTLIAPPPFLKQTIEAGNGSE